MAGSGVPSLTRTRKINDELKKELLRILLGVYMDARYINPSISFDRNLTSSANLSELRS